MIDFRLNYHILEKYCPKKTLLYTTKPVREVETAIIFLQIQN